MSVKHTSTNQLRDFEFHDSVWTLDQVAKETLVVLIKYLNIHKGTEEKQADSDMEIDIAKVTFQGFSVLSFEPGRAWKMGADGKLYTDEPLVSFHGEDAYSKLMNELQHGIRAYHLDIDENNVCSIDACGDSPFFTAQFVFDSVTVEWDAYRKKRGMSCLPTE